MILAIDIGNSRIKWKAFTLGQAATEKGYIDNSEVAYKAFADKWKDKVLSVHAANVRHHETVTALKECFGSVKFVTIAPPAEGFGIRVAYDSPDKLGVDRWLAMIEAKALSGSLPVLVFDLGTAATLDMIDPLGEHQGGFIVPGLSRLRESLIQGTDRVCFSDIDVTELRYGVNTDEAVNYGVYSLLSSWIQAEIQKARLIYPDVQVYLSGGDAKSLIQFVDNDVILHEDLVLDGLFRVAIS